MTSHPLRTILLCILLVAAAGLAAPGGRAGDEPADAPAAVSPADRIFPLSAVRPGMRGTAFTVMSGTRIESFEVEVIDVMHDFLSKQDMILVRCLGERIHHLGIAQGMSGSPVFIDGKIAGALSYTWSWVKEPFGGVTPIEAMLAEGKRVLEGRPSGAEPPTLLRSPRPPRIPGESGAKKDLAPITTPVCVGGFSHAGRAELGKVLGTLGLDIQAAGTGVVAGAPGNWANLDAPIVPGAALSVDLVRGDLCVTALGTCTFVDGETIYGFGHGFQDIGETLFPLSVAYIYAVVPSQNLSFKLGGSIREIGALVQDRQSGIVGVLGRTAPMVPFEITLRNAATGRSETFHFEITANRVLFQRMMLLSLREAFSKAERTLGRNTKSYRLEVKLEGVETPWVYEDAFVSFDAGLSRLLIGLVDRVLIHPSQRVAFEYVKLDVAIENMDRRAFIETVTASVDEVRPGKEVELTVRLRLREGGGLILERLRLQIPADARPGNFGILVTGGDNVAAEVATPIDLLDIPALYDAFYKSTELVAVVPTGRVNVDMDGTLYRNLPLSALPRLVRSLDATQVKVHPVTENVRRTVPYIVAGADKVVLRVVD